MKIDFSTAKWLNQPSVYQLNKTSLSIKTEPHTDCWQRSYYGFSRDNAHSLLLESQSNFSFSVKTRFDYQHQFDQCGIIVYLDSNNWFKASIEYENETFSRLGSVVTNQGYSDWATSDIPNVNTLWYRLSRRGPDMLIEYSPDGVDFKQMRIFHLHGLGETAVQMCKTNKLADSKEPGVNFGLYACSPLDSSFTAKFEQFKFGDCLWLAHNP